MVDERGFDSSELSTTALSPHPALLEDERLIELGVVVVAGRDIDRGEFHPETIPSRFQAAYRGVWERWFRALPADELWRRGPALPGEALLSEAELGGVA